MSGFEIKIENDNTEKTLKLKDEAVARALMIIGGKAEGYVKALTPVDTGRLRNSITYKTKKQKSSPQSPAKGSDGVRGTPTEAQVFIGTNVEYAPYVEYGAQGRPARHMIKNGVGNHVDEYKNILKSELDGV